jgi:DNA mismatch endonuclease (patch repair protein)
VDVVDRVTRSRMMSGIRSKDTVPELTVRSYLHRAGLRFRLHAQLPGKPDLILPRYRVALFVHGCFWHRHSGCRFATTPASNAVFWQRKFDANVARDARVKAKLEELGWQVRVVWACQLGERELGELVTTIRVNSSGQRPGRR